jgi:hypothetical protein
MKRPALIITLALTLMPLFGRGRSSGHHSHSTYSSHSYHRSRAARAAFQRSHPCPATGRASGPCPGYIVDHVKPLACGGADAPSNMQWQSTADAKAKDQWERTGCAK